MTENTVDPFHEYRRLLSGSSRGWWPAYMAVVRSHVGATTVILFGIAIEWVIAFGWGGIAWVWAPALTVFWAIQEFHATEGWREHWQWMVRSREEHEAAMARIYANHERYMDRLKSRYA